MPSLTPRELLEKIEGRIQELDGEIRTLARRWAWDCPDNWEDLAQEARCAIYQQLKQDPGCPRSYLFSHAKDAILDYRKKGASVDGKLDRTYHRTRVWQLASLDTGPEVVPAEYSGLYFKPHQLRPVEDLALADVVYGELVARLTGPQSQYLALRLQGYSGRQVDALMGVNQSRGARLRKEIKRQARDILQPAPAPTGRGRARR